MNAPINKSQLAVDLAISQSYKDDAVLLMQEMAEFVELHCTVDCQALIEQFEECPIDDAHHYDEWSLFVQFMKYLDQDVAAKAWIDYRVTGKLYASIVKYEESSFYLTANHEGKEIIIQMHPNSSTEIAPRMTLEMILVHGAWDSVAIWYDGLLEAQYGLDELTDISQIDIQQKLAA